MVGVLSASQSFSLFIGNLLCYCFFQSICPVAARQDRTPTNHWLPYEVASRWLLVLSFQWIVLPCAATVGFCNALAPSIRTLAHSFNCNILRESLYLRVAWIGGEQPRLCVAHAAPGTNLDIRTHTHAIFLFHWKLKVCCHSYQLGMCTWQNNVVLKPITPLCVDLLI